MTEYWKLENKRLRNLRTKVVNSQSPTSKPLYQSRMEEGRFQLPHKQISILLIR